MSIPHEAQTREHNAPNAIGDRMRRRIARVGLLVGVLSAFLASLVIFFICACAHIR